MTGHCTTVGLHRGKELALDAHEVVVKVTLGDSWGTEEHLGGTELALDVRERVVKVQMSGH